MRNIDSVYDQVEIDEDELTELEECYMPKRPLVFDKTGKCLIYKSEQDIKETTRLFGCASAFAMIPVYCLMRAIQRMSWWRIILWGIPSAFSSNMLRNSYTMTSRVVTHMYLKEDG